MNSTQRSEQSEQSGNTLQDSFLLPATYQQRALWLVEQLESPNAAYNVPVAYRLRGPLNVPALEKSIQEIVNRHEALRTTFTADGVEPAQLIAEELLLPLKQIDLSELSETEREAEAAVAMLSHARTRFDLLHGPLISVCLVKLAAGEHLLLLTVHHIIADRWSLEIFYGELSTIYDALVQGATPSLPELAIQYGDYAVWQNERLKDEALATQLSFWKQQLEGMPLVLELPTDLPRPAARDAAGDWVRRKLPKDLCSALNAFSRQEGGTLFMTLLAGFETLLYRQSGQRDFVLGSPIAGRKQQGVDALIGYFVNTLVIPCHLGGNPTFRELFHKVRATSLATYSNQDLPFELLVKELQPERDRSHNPVFQVMFVLQNQPVVRRELSGLLVEPLWTDTQTSKFDLTLMVEEGAEDIEFQLEYSTQLFRQNSATAMLARLEALLRGALADPEARIDTLPILSHNDLESLPALAAGPNEAYPSSECIHHLVEAQARRSPGAIALISGKESVTYSALMERAERLANHLVQLGAGPNAVVGICLHRSIEMLVGVLGVLRAGAAYLPLDPAYPRERLNFMLQHSRSSVLLTETSLAGHLSNEKLEVLCLDNFEFAPLPETHPGFPQTTPEDLAYVIYTSGSTGKPKGVAMPHRPLVNLMTWQQRTLPLPPGSRTLQFTSLSFDVSFQEIFSTWIAGGTLVLVSQELRTDFSALLAFLREQSIERLYLPFAALQELAETAQHELDLPLSLREVITAGEQLRVTSSLVRLFERLRECRLHNHYGPSETHVVTAYTMHGPPSTWTALPPIGRPVANTQMYIADPHGNPVAPGLPGELMIAGTCLAHGYLHQPGLTRERFVDITLLGGQSCRAYRSGDLARFLPDGNIEYLGRTDFQVKIRGYRIELGEIEATLAAHPDIGQCAIHVFESESRTKKLCAYFIPAQQDKVPSPFQLKEFLSERLPEYMLPAAFLKLETLPLTPSGKVDRKKLPEPKEAITPSVQGGYREPGDLIEMRLLTIWEKLLERYPIGVDQDFFELGGHSLLALRLFSQIQQVFGVRLPLITLIEARTVERLAAQIRNQRESEAWSAVVALQPGGSRTPLFCVPGGGSNLLAYRWLLQYLDSDLPFYGLQPPYLQGNQAPFETIEEMAALYVAEIRKVQTNGPYRLKGWCIGGLVAYEMAQQLTQMGEKVALLIMVDTIFPKDISLSARLKHNLGIMSDGFKDVFKFGANKAKAVGKFNLSQLISWLQIKALGLGMAKLTHEQIEANILYAEVRASKQYRAKPYPGKLSLIWPLDQPDQPYVNSREEWSKMTESGVEHIELPGDHSSIYTEPLVANLAKCLSDCCRRTQ